MSKEELSAFVEKYTPKINERASDWLEKALSELRIELFKEGWKQGYEAGHKDGRQMEYALSTRVEKV